MYFDFEDYRPDTPRIPTAISLRETVLLSVVAHLLLLIAYLVVPDEWFEREPDSVLAEHRLVPDLDDQPPLRFVEVIPLADRPAPPISPADQSDMDRRSSTLEVPPDALDPQPFMQGDTPEMIVGGPSESLASPPPPPEPAAPEVTDASALPPADEGFATLPVPAPPEPDPAAQTARSLGDSLRNLQQYLRQENFDNPRGGDTEQAADIQFDSMGVDFGPWLLRFKHQVERNWLLPQLITTHRRYERVVVRFTVLRSGFITGVQVLQPASIPALTNSAVNSLRLSNPTAALPPEYPRQEMPIVATFHINYNAGPGAPE